MSNWNKSKEERNKEALLKAELMDRYPLLYYYARRPGQHSMRYGLSIGMGWLPMIEEMSAKVETILNKFIIENPGEKFPTAVQVKEKFGTLRFYTNIINKEVDDIISEYEDKSYTVCENCSSPGTIRPEGWHRVLCNSCEETKNK